MSEPLLLKPFYSERPWGGNRLKTLFGKDVPYDRTGESWEVSVRPGCESVVDGGIHNGLTLDEVRAHVGEGLFGTRCQGEFPLLIKLIDACDLLSVQVHPDDAYAQLKEGEPFGKSEAWVVLHADPNARLVMGLRSDMGDIGKTIENGVLEQRLIWTDAHRGDVYNIPAGTVHALGAGMVVYEVQQNSDTTYRLYDWGRPRQTHVKQALDVMRDVPNAGLVVPPQPVAGLSRLITSPYFILDAYSGDAAYNADGSTFFAITAATDTAIVHTGGTLTLPRGSSALIPADMGAFALSGEGYAAYL